MNRIAIEAKRDFLERLSSTTPIKAVAELIWNGLDANAGQVSVRLEVNPLDGLETIRVTDTGFGINHDHVQALFGGLGDSWKKQKVRQAGRALHGKNGQGRFKAFALGNRVEWNTVYDSPTGRMRYQVFGRAEALTDLEYSDPTPAAGDPTGTEVVVSGIQKSLGSLQRDNARQELAKLFAVYLSQYPDLRLDYDGVRVDPTELQSGRKDFLLDEITLTDGRTAQAMVSIIEWQMKADRVLHLCDADGVSLHEKDLGVHGLRKVRPLPGAGPGGTAGAGGAAPRRGKDRRRGEAGGESPLPPPPQRAAEPDRGALETGADLPV
jgi:hypothetical protein